MKHNITVLVVASIIIGSIGGSVITAWRYESLLGTQGHRDLASFKSSLAYLAKKDGVLRSHDEAIAHAKTLLALSTISLGQFFDTLDKEVQSDAVRLVAYVEENPSLRLDNGNDIEKWASQVRQCIVNMADGEAPAIAKCSRDAAGNYNSATSSAASL